MLKAKKELNSDLNLTPFIDLLSTIVCFLLVSAVWVQVASMDLKQSQGTEAAAPTESAALDVDFTGKDAVNLTLKLGSKTLHTSKLKEASLQELVKKINMSVISMKQLPVLKGAQIDSVLVGPHLAATHGDMVAVLDGLRVHGLNNVGVKPSAGGN
jgi:biopolymer transport protein TolR